MGFRKLTIEERIKRWNDHCINKGVVLHHIAVHPSDYYEGLEGPEGMRITVLGRPDEARKD
jgi:hypothetical protein